MIVEKRRCCCLCIVLLRELGNLYVNKKVKLLLREQQAQCVRREAEQNWRILKKKDLWSQNFSHPFCTLLHMFCFANPKKFISPKVLHYIPCFKFRPVQSTVRLARLYFPWDTSTYARGCVIATICISLQEQYSLFKTAPGNFYTQGCKIIASKLSFT